MSSTYDDRRLNGLAQTPFYEIVREVSSDRPSPGGGAVGALIVALAAACATKAITISIKHHPDNVELQRAKDQLDSLALAGCELADADSYAFEQLMAAYKLPKGDETQRVTRRATISRNAIQAAKVGEAIVSHAEGVRSCLMSVLDRVHSNIINDAYAAIALLDANQRIQEDNIRVNIAIAG